MNAIRHKLRKSKDELIELYEKLAKLEDLLNDNEFEIELSKCLEKASKERYERLQLFKKNAQLSPVDVKDKIEEYLLSEYQITPMSKCHPHYVPSHGEERVMLSSGQARFIYNNFIRWNMEGVSDESLCISRMYKIVRKKRKCTVEDQIIITKKKIDQKTIEYRHLKETYELIEL